MAERRPTLTASARVGVGNLRSGQKKACGAVEQKKVPKSLTHKDVITFKSLRSVWSGGGHGR